MTPPKGQPQLIVVVDTEEEYDWRAELDRSRNSVTHIDCLHRVQDIFDAAGVTPVYVIDYPVANQDSAVTRLRELVRTERALIGAHLHPLVNPPYIEELSRFNAYPGNLPREIEREKLIRLRDRIEANFGRRPTIYKAGGYGKGPNTHALLEELGFEIDISPSPPMDYRADGGPDFRRHDPAPYLFGAQRSLLCLANTGAYVGYLWPWGAALAPALEHPRLRWVRLPGVAARLGALERIRLSPEGYTFEEMRRVTTALLARRHELFVLSFHSPSIVPGNTPFVRTVEELAAFLGRLRDYLAYFQQHLGGTFTTPQEVKAGLEG